MDIDEVANADVTRSPPGALRVEIRCDVGRTADIEVTADAASEPHSAVKSRQHQNEAAVLTPGGERFVHAEVAALCATVTVRIPITISTMQY